MIMEKSLNKLSQALEVRDNSSKQMHQPQISTIAAADIDQVSWVQQDFLSAMSTVLEFRDRILLSRSEGESLGYEAQLAFRVQSSVDSGLHDDLGESTAWDLPQTPNLTVSETQPLHLRMKGLREKLSRQLEGLQVTGKMMQEASMQIRSGSEKLNLGMNDMKHNIAKSGVKQDD
jgi:hypothetical protein